MPNEWNPFKDKQTTTNAEATSTTTTTTNEKSPAELIAESVSAAIKPLVESNTALNSRIEAIENNTRRPAPQVTPEEIPSVFDNEDAAFGRRLGPLVLQNLDLQARMTYGEVKSDYLSRGFSAAFAEYENEILGVLANSPLLQPDPTTGGQKLCRGDRTYIENIINMVFGKHALQNGVKFGGKDKGFFLESASGSSTAGEVGNVNDGLTDAQRRLFQRMGIDPKEGAKTAGKLKFVS